MGLKRKRSPSADSRSHEDDSRGPTPATPATSVETPLATLDSTQKRADYETDDEEDQDAFQNLIDQIVVDSDDEESGSDPEESSEEADRELKQRLKGMSIDERRKIFANLSPASLFKSLNTWTDCAAATPSVTSVTELKKWCQSTIFLPTAMYFLEGYLWPQQSTEKVRGRGDEFSTIMNVIIAEQENRTRNLTEDWVDRSNWTATDWNASCLKRIFDKDAIDADGLWDGHRVSSDRKYTVLYAIWTVFVRECAVSRLQKTWPLLKISAEKEKQLRKRFPHLNEALKKEKVWKQKFFYATLLSLEMLF